MIAEFKTADGTQFQINTQTLRWTMNVGSGDDLKVEGGDLTESALDTYSLEPRTPKTGLEDPQKPGPAAGFCTIGIHAKIVGDTLHVLAYGNQPIKEFTLPVPIANQRYEIVGHVAA